MENASKALLIAAAVLIVILIVAFGMNIFKSAKTAGNAEEATGAISSGMTSATDKLQGAILGQGNAGTVEFTNGTRTKHELTDLIKKINYYNTQNQDHIIIPAYTGTKMITNATGTREIMIVKPRKAVSEAELTDDLHKNTSNSSADHIVGKIELGDEAGPYNKFDVKFKKSADGQYITWVIINEIDN